MGVLEASTGWSAIYHALERPYRDRNQFLTLYLQSTFPFTEKQTLNRLPIEQVVNQIQGSLVLTKGIQALDREVAECESDLHERQNETVIQRLMSSTKTHHGKRNNTDRQLFMMTFYLLQHPIDSRIASVA